MLSPDRALATVGDGAPPSGGAPPPAVCVYSSTRLCSALVRKRMLLSSLPLRSQHVDASQRGLSRPVRAHPRPRGTHELVSRHLNRAADELLGELRELVLAAGGDSPTWTCCR